jgi:hypothetical protein
MDVNTKSQLFSSSPDAFKTLFEAIFRLTLWNGSFV